MLKTGFAIVIALMLFVSGFIHATQPYFFIHNAAAYRIIPIKLIGITVIFVPALQIVAALCILTGIAKRVSLLFAAVMFAGFTIAQAIVMSRGESPSCGCFGTASTAVGPTSMAISILCCGGCLLLLRVDRGKEPAHSKS